MSNKDGIEKLLLEKRRRLQKLKETEARLGINTPPEIRNEIEDIEAEIEQLQGTLKLLEKDESQFSSRNQPRVKQTPFLIGGAIALITFLVLCICTIGLLIREATQTTSVTSTTPSPPSTVKDNSLEGPLPPAAASEHTEELIQSPTTNTQNPEALPTLAITPSPLPINEVISPSPTRMPTNTLLPTPTNTVMPPFSSPTTPPIPPTPTPPTPIPVPPTPTPEPTTPIPEPPTPTPLPAPNPNLVAAWSFDNCDGTDLKTPHNSLCKLIWVEFCQ